jgi:hypothetical protein
MPYQPKMDILDRFWPDPSFRKPIGDLLNLTPTQMETLRGLTDKSFELSGDAAKQFGLDATDFSLALTLLRTLYIGAREEGEAAVLEQLTQLAASRTDADARALATNLAAKRKEFGALLELRPEVERRARLAAIQRAGMAALEEAALFVDLRIVDGGDWKMVPVVLARLNFDEPIQVGASSVTFQIPDAALSSLIEQLERAQKTAEDARKRLEDQML